ncbi:MAG TPA: serine hydrolase [Bacteriovoracaceae bacterium]|nr:serine hydrolase [Bacteriovoracaceae bacterium]
MHHLEPVLDFYFPVAPFDAVAVGVIDFNGLSFQTLERDKSRSGSCYYYDLASMTKVLTNSLSYFLSPDSFTREMLLCLSHRGGLPAWGLLQQRGWEETILSYGIKESPTLYSDFSALRVMLEFNRSGTDQKTLCQTVWDQEVLNWLDLSSHLPLLQFGYVGGEPNFGQVHDPNARVIKKYCSHAGLFGTIRGVCQTLINYQSRTGFITKVKEDLRQHQNRFALGWDRVSDPANTLAGAGCGPFTFGHLGFTGTSVWIDPDKMLGHVILTNATRDYWFEKKELNELRRALGQKIWEQK